MSRVDPSAPVPARSIVTPKFGRRLRGLRGTRTRGDVMRQLAATYHLKFSRSSLLQYERGTVAAPDPVVLWALARIYGTPFDALAEALVRERLSLGNVKPTPEAMAPMVLSDDERRVVDVLRHLPKPRREVCIEIVLGLQLD